MATSYQPLLDTPRTKHLHRRALFCVLSLVAMIALASLIALRTSSPSYQSVSTLICDRAYDPVSCVSQLSELSFDGLMPSMIDEDHLTIHLKKSSAIIRDAMQTANHSKNEINSPREQAALADCVELMGISMGQISDSILALSNRAVSSRADAHTWLSSVLTNHFTCLDGLEGQSRSILDSSLNDLISRARVSLAILVALSPSKVDFLQPLKSKFPSWITHGDRKLLEMSAIEINANVVVAQDGSGDYKTVKESVAAAPTKSKTRYVIYIKKGTYKEQVEIPSSKTNIMLTGDGMDLTIITGSLNVVDGSTTFKSATVAAVGTGFIAQDIWFQNTAGPEKHQAVALRVGSDKSVINRCKIDAYQDTLYSHSNRQFYRDCYVTGTVDYIFGNAAAVYQNSKLVARKPMSNQQNMVTAQGREDPNQNTGTSIQNCNIIASSDLEPVKTTIKTYLGRPWKEYSRTVVMQSYIGDHIDSAGWSIWSGDFALKTLYYGEYKNRGPGSDSSKRVTWSGYHVITDANEARNFTVSQLIQGAEWLDGTGVTYTEGL